MNDSLVEDAILQQVLDNAPPAKFGSVITVLYYLTIGRFTNPAKYKLARDLIRVAWQSS